MLKQFGMILLLSGSAIAQGAQDQVVTDPVPDDPVAATKVLMRDLLVDPDSATYQMIALHSSKCKRGWAKKGADWIGYSAQIDINSKNRMGGYTGYTRYTVLFRGQEAWRAIEGADFGPYGPSKGMLGLGGGAGVCLYLR